MAHPLMLPIKPAISSLFTMGPTIIPALASSLTVRVLPLWRSFAAAPAKSLAMPPQPSSQILPRRQPVLSPFAIAAVNPLLLRFMPVAQSAASSGSPTRQTTRSFGTVSAFRPSTRSSLLSRTRYSVTRLNARTFTGGVSRSLLAKMEEQANRHPESPSIQSSFYSMLMTANMPQIVMERYSSGHFARNPSCDEMYQRALAMMNPAQGPNNAAQAAQYGGDSQYNSAPAHGGFSPAQLQAAGQAVAAQSRGGNIGVANMPTGDGSKQGPLHVRVDETTSSLVFKWIKFVAWFALFTYLSLIVVTMLIDSLNMLPKRSGSRGQPEVKAEAQKTRFNDVHGCDEAKEELQDLVEFLKNPEKFNTLGGKLPKGVLLVGPPGTGKTLLARAVAGEAGVPFFYMSGSEFDEVYVGVGAKRVRELFNSAKSKSPSIIFIDELDAIGGRRNSRDAAYVKQTLNQLLTELDGFEQNSGVIILAATNFPELLDKALTRPGRFDRNVVVGLPDVRGRIAILNHHASKIKAGKDVNLEGVALTTAGLSGAELENIVNEAAVHASKIKAHEVSMLDFEWAKDKVIMGAERKTMVIDPKEKEMTAYHEAGHALLKWYTNPKTLHKVTILPRGMTLGHMAHHQEKDKYSSTATDYSNLILVCYGGFVAEELVFGADKTTDGVSSDLQQATKIAFRMVAHFGMSADLGPVEFSHMYENLSAHTKAAVENEVRQLLSVSYKRAKTMLGDNRKDLDKLAKALLKYETLDRDEIGKVLKGESLPGRVPVPPGGTMLVHPRPEEPGMGDENNSPAPPPIGSPRYKSDDQ
ncbi:P-loop containing nucleoside triphosphate hydrolase protein [Zalerion maritima]|uniref:P-loop containing nucleoside triphosphate hydrolase protein n=1 Tax=Zalerion maritima TaxID=339359 RepID=A0AAD5RQT4_9PEZI|nr:P-loop containing nucleoside triphosphate hydrolase protein [Zalerion maritima]